MINKLKIWYINFIEKDKNFFELPIYFIFYLLSKIYASIITIRNFLYDKKIIKEYKSPRKIISIGNLSWGGCGKTTLSIYLSKKLSLIFKVAILRRGWGEDEDKLIKEFGFNVFSAKDRVKLIKSLEDKFDVFILDDGFQYRRLHRNIDIVIMSAREFKKRQHLLPLYFFREPIKSLRRSDFLIINHSDELPNKDFILKLQERFKNLKIFFAKYNFLGIKDLNGNPVDLECILDKKVAALTAIGYPEGFLKIIKKLNLNLSKTFIYPDHYTLNELEFLKIEKILLEQDIEVLLITHKDKFHIPTKNSKIKIFILEIDLAIQNEETFLKELFYMIK